MAYSRDEQETVLVFNNDLGEWDVYSSVPKHIRKLMTLGNFKVLEDECGRPIVVRGKLNEKQVSMKKERVMSEEQRLQASERAKKARLSK